MNDYSLYLKVGDHVFHKHYTRWGIGIVTEERRSEVPGGFCYVRIMFQDGETRVFDNNFKSDNCCYYKGVEKLGEKEKRKLARESRKAKTVSITKEKRRILIQKIYRMLKEKNKE